MAEIDLGRQEGRGANALVAAGLEVSEPCGQERSSDAIADGVHLPLARGLLDRVEAEDQPLLDIVPPVLFGMAFVRVDPGNDKDGVPLRHHPADQALLGVEIQDVELVDPGRRDEDRPAEDLLRLRRVLNDLADVVLRHHRAGSDGEVPADLEAGGIGLSQLQAAVARRHVLGEHLHAAYEIGAVLRHGLAVEFGVGQNEVRGRDGVGDLLHVEGGLLARVRIETIGPHHQIVRPAGGEDVDLLEEVEEEVAAPFLVGKALVARTGARLLHRLARKLAHRAAPDVEIAGEEMRLRLHGPGRIGHPVAADLRQRRHHLAVTGRSIILDLAALARLDPGGGGLADLLEDMRHVASEGFRVSHRIIVETGRTGRMRVSVGLIHGRSSSICREHREGGSSARTSGR